VTKEDVENLRFRIDSEGFDYCFRDYSSFKEVEDAEFHRLRLAYVEAANALDDYIPNEEDGEDAEEEGEEGVLFGEEEGLFDPTAP